MSNDPIQPSISDEAQTFSPPSDVNPQGSPNTPSFDPLSPEHMRRVGGIPGIIRRLKKPLIIIAIVFGVLLGSYLAFNTLNGRQQTPVEPTPTPTVSPTPTPMRHMAPAATTSAFLKFDMSLATLSATLGSVQITDSTLTPPTVELPLGFSNQ